MRLNIFEQHKPIFGIHLNGTALKFVQLQKQSGGISFVGYSNVPLPKNLIANDTILDAAALAKLIQQNLIKPQFGRITTNRVVVSVPESKSFIRVIHIPEMSESQAENAVMFEAEAYIPLPLDQVYFDWQILGRAEGKMEVLIIASPKEFVDKYLAALEKIGLKLVAVEVESQSVVRSLIKPGDTENILIADLDAYKTALIMVEKGNLQFTSSIPLAGNSFTDKISQALTIPTAKAEAIKKEFGIANTPDYPNLKTYLLPVVNDLAAEIKNILKFHYDHSEQRITRLILSGGSAKLKHLDELLPPLLAEFSDLRVEIANPLVNLENLQNQDLSAYEALSFTTAIGLAMRDLQ
jgi:type IV pilus assembly protein PilM